jgi:hypothetical protein
MKGWLKCLGLIALGGSLLGGCSGDDPETACDRAVAKAKQCEVDPPPGVGATSCSGIVECAANCVNDATCSELQSESTNSDLFACISECG